MDLVPNVSDAEIAEVEGADKPIPSEEVSVPATTEEAPKSRRERAELRMKDVEKRLASLDKYEADLREERERRIRLEASLDEIRRMNETRTRDATQTKEQEDAKRQLADLDSRIQKAAAGEDFGEFQRLQDERTRFVARQIAAEQLAEFRKEQAAQRQNQIPPAFEAVRAKHHDIDTHPAGPGLVRAAFDAMVAQGEPQSPETFDKAFTAAAAILGVRRQPRNPNGTYSQPAPSNVTDREAGGQAGTKLPATVLALAKDMVARGHFDSVEEYEKLYFEGKR